MKTKTIDLAKERLRAIELLRITGILSDLLPDPESLIELYEGMIDIFDTLLRRGIATIEPTPDRGILILDRSGHIISAPLDHYDNLRLDLLLEYDQGHRGFSFSEVKSA